MLILRFVEQAHPGLKSMLQLPSLLVAQYLQQWQTSRFEDDIGITHEEYTETKMLLRII